MAEIKSVPPVSPKPATKPRNPRVKADPNETKAQRFQRLGNARIPRALKALASVKNLSNKNQYEYTQEQAAKIKEVLSAAVRSLSDAFTGVKENGPLFRL